MEGLTEKKTDLLTEEQAARKLLVSRRTLQRMCRERRIEFVQVTPRTRGFTEEHITDYIRRKTITPPKFIDSPLSERLSFPWKGGVNQKSTGDSLSERKRMKEELRSWR